MRNKRLLYVAEVHLPGRKASSIHVMRMCKAFADQGLKVRLLAFRSGQYKDVLHLCEYYGIDDSFDIKVLKSPGTGRLSAFYMAFASIFQYLKFGPDIAYTRSPITSFFFSFLSGMFVFEAHNFVYESRHKWVPTFFKRFSKASNFLGLIAISSALKKMYVQKGTAAENIFVAHDGADLKSLEEQEELKGQYPLNAGYFGSVFKGRGIEVIIGMAGRMPETGFHIFGGEASDIPGNPTLPDNLIFYGFVPPSKVHCYRNSCDVLLAPYQPEVFVSEKQAYSTSTYMSPLKIFEYMSARKAIIVSDMPVLREVLSDDCAMLVPPDDVSCWVDALNQLESEKDKREQLASKAYSLFREKYSWKQRAGTIYQWLNNRINQ